VVIGIRLCALHADVQALCLLLQFDLPMGRLEIVTNGGHSTPGGQTSNTFHSRRGFSLDWVCDCITKSG